MPVLLRHIQHRSHANWCYLLYRQSLLVSGDQTAVVTLRIGTVKCLLGRCQCCRRVSKIQYLGNSPREKRPVPMRRSVCVSTPL